LDGGRRTRPSISGYNGIARRNIYPGQEHRYKRRCNCGHRPALALVEEDHGPALAMEVARILVLYMRRSGGQSQFSAPLDSQALAGKRFSELHEWILENLCEPLSVEHLADRAGMSPRNFSRVFSSETGTSPGRYVESIRLNLAREMLESGKDPLDKVAEACGFGREERLRRAFLRRFRITPVEYRNHFKNDEQ